MFKRITLALVAASILAIPVAQAGPRHYDKQAFETHQHKTYKSWKQRSAKQRKWHRGGRYANWKKRDHVRDYRRHGLRKPGRGQQWIKVDDQYLLVSVATGFILGLAIAR